MRFFEKILICVVLLFLILLTGCNNYQKNDKFNEIKERGVLLVGTTGDYQPMSYLNKKTNEYEGYDADLASDLAKYLGVKLEYVSTSWQTLMSDAISGKFDVAISGITITSERKKKAFMSEGYLKNGKTILCRKEDINKYINLKTINKPNVRVIENPGGQNEKFARKYLPKANIIIHNVNEEIPELVATGYADVMITENTEANFYSNKDKRLAVPMRDKLLNHGYIGILIPPQNKSLLNHINNFIKQERKNGRLSELEQKYIYFEATPKK